MYHCLIHYICMYSSVALIPVDSSFIVSYWEFLEDNLRGACIVYELLPLTRSLALSLICWLLRLKKLLHSLIMLTVFFMPQIQCCSNVWLQVLQGQSNSINKVAK